MNSTKLTDNKAVIAYLAEKFPKCFTLKGDAQPLKIGLFQDLAARLSEDDTVSKTQLRGAIRHYTTSWRYLRGTKAGAKRVDLDGELGEELSEDHIEHAQKVLSESQKKAKERNDAKAPKTAKIAKSSTDKPSAAKTNRTRIPAKNKKPKVVEPVLTGEKIIDTAALSINQAVLVTLGNSPMKGIIVDIAKSEAKVQLASGMVVKVKPEHLLAQS
ncbi:MAG: RNA chaperone ProQ [Gammaproteobacteria bacterium]|nr:RNA chaperone ProQ [Gammaproteobacteria bacterium]